MGIVGCSDGWWIEVGYAELNSWHETLLGIAGGMTGALEV